MGRAVTDDDPPTTSGVSAPAVQKESPSEASTGPAPRRGPREAARRTLAALAGPALITFTALFALRAFAFHGLITTQQGDILQFWLPSYCFQGHVLAAGHIPAFDPFTLAGHRFAGDPQQGWLYLPAMALFAALPCATAIRWFVVLQPILAGLGTYWFLRAEDLRRSAATTGGLVLAMAMAGSYVGLQVPFAGSMAWTALMLAATARLFRSRNWSGRLWWLTLVALAWGQVATAHLSNGLVTATLALAIYVGFRLVSEVRAGRRAPNAAGLLCVLLVVALPLVNLAILWPRASYLPRTVLGLGFDKLNELQAGFAGVPYAPVAHHEPWLLNSNWVLGLASSPGAYLGAAALLLAFAGAWSTRHRRLFVTTSVFALACYGLSLPGIAGHLAPHLRWLPFSDFYVHAPERFRDGVLFALPIMAAVGLEAWLDAPTLRRRLAMLVPGTVVWWVLPFATGLAQGFPLLLAIGTVAGVAALAGASPTRARRRLRAVDWTWAVPVVLAVELSANAFIGLSGRHGQPVAAWGPLDQPTVGAATWVQRGPIAEAIAQGGGGRFITLTQRGLNKPGRAALMQSPHGWAALADQQSMIFGIEDADGYNPTQDVRFWSYERAADTAVISDNGAYLLPPVPSGVIDLLDVRWVVSPAGSSPNIGPAHREVLLEGKWILSEVVHPSPRATVLTAWRVVSSPNAALGIVRSPAFDPSSAVVLEGPPSFPGGGTGAGGTSPLVGTGPTAGTATYTQEGPQAATIRVEAAAPAIVLIRNVYDPDWHVTLDGRPADVVPADYIDEGIAVPAGRHTIELRFVDPTIGQGFAGSAVALTLLLGGAMGLRAVRSSGSLRSRHADPAGPCNP